MRVVLAVAIGSLLLTGCSSTGQESTVPTVTGVSSASPTGMPSASPTEPAVLESSGVTEAATADEVVQRLKSEGLCEDPGNFDVENIGERLIAACGSPVPFLVADAPFKGPLAAEWCNNASSLTKKTVEVVEGSSWTIIRPMPSEPQTRAITDAVGGTASRLSQAC